ncbi:hypothetical protein Pmani_017517 [Petrolisthes manimaculis]|uniref:Uncharacterized protein n=1 Tax=Petrolisthes manimaculis TaxID=1843537 RepID=A0AAE1PN85_9EUCA|nr:hypothetical protein Pmani_017517 [Petrolisthes manimaculis]
MAESGLESKKRASQTSIRSSESQEDHQKENQPNSFDESKFKRTGSVQYRNKGWKSSQKLEKKDSSQSIQSNSSNCSGKEGMMNPTSKIQISQPKRSSSEQQVYLQQKFDDISSILTNCGVNEDVLIKLKN